MSVTNGMQGARLEFVVRRLSQPITRAKVKYDKKQKRIVEETKQVEGFMVYMPNGCSYRLTATELVKKGFDRQPAILNLERVTGTDTPAGRFKFAINDEARQKAYRELEDLVVKACTRKHGESSYSVEEREDAAVA